VGLGKVFPINTWLDQKVPKCVHGDNFRVVDVREFMFGREVGIPTAWRQVAGRTE
jgi:hypothetical protein